MLSMPQCVPPHSLANIICIHCIVDSVFLISNINVIFIVVNVHHKTDSKMQLPGNKKSKTFVVHTFN